MIINQIGTVVGGNFESRKQRLTRRESKLSLADELANDLQFKERSDKVMDAENQKRQRPRRSKKRHL